MERVIGILIMLLACIIGGDLQNKIRYWMFLIVFSIGVGFVMYGITDGPRIGDELNYFFWLAAFVIGGFAILYALSGGSRSGFTLFTIVVLGFVVCVVSFLNLLFVSDDPYTTNARNEFTLVAGFTFQVTECDSETSEDCKMDRPWHIILIGAVFFLAMLAILFYRVRHPNSIYIPPTHR